MSESRAVILGSGVTGIAWETGILRGLGDEGVDLGTADAIIGTSAGSFAARALLPGRSRNTLIASSATMFRRSQPRCPRRRSMGGRGLSLREMAMRRQSAGLVGGSGGPYPALFADRFCSFERISFAS